MSELGKYSAIGKIDVNEIKPIIKQNKIESQKLESVNYENKLLEQKDKLTKLVNTYFQIANKECILSKITDINTINDDEIILISEDYHTQIYLILDVILFSMKIKFQGIFVVHNKYKLKN